MIAHFYCPKIGSDDAVHTWVRAVLPVLIADVEQACRCGLPVELRSLPPVVRQRPTINIPPTLEDEVR